MVLMKKQQAIGAKKEVAQVDIPLCRGKLVDHIAATKRLTLSMTIQASANAMGN